MRARRAFAMAAAPLAVAALTGCIDQLMEVRVPDDYKSYFVVAARRCPGVLTPQVLAAQAYVESHFNPDAVSPAGAQGMMQIIPEVWKRYGADADGSGRASPFNPADSVATAAKYDCFLAGETRSLGSSAKLWLAAYNAGLGAVQKYGGIPPYPETENYCDQVMRRSEQFARQFPEPSNSALSTAPR